MYFFRDSNGLEVDILLQQGRAITALEVKSSSTYQSSMLTSLKKLAGLSPALVNAYLVYAGDEISFTGGQRAINFNQVETLLAG